MSNIIIQGNEINARKYLEKITIEGIGEEKTLNPRMIVAKGGNNMINYSTEEQVIGTWIDGKPLYQKTVKFNASNTSDSVTYNHGIQNIDLVVSYDACLISDGGNARKLLQLYSNLTQEYFATVYSITRTSISFIYGSWLRNVGYSDYPCYVTLRYTKTTDYT